MQQIKAQDAAFLYMESANNLTHVTGFTIFDPSTAPGGGVRFKDIIEHVASRSHTSPIYRRRLAHVPFELDYPYWVDDEYFDIEYHISHGRLPAPGDWRQLCIHMARYHSKPLNMNRPPWEMFVVEGLSNVEGLPPGCYALATKIHHVAVDGAAAVKFFSGLSDIDPQGTPAVDIDAIDTPVTEAPGLPKMLHRAVVNNITSPVRMAETVLRAAPNLVRAAHSALVGAGGRSGGVPDTRFNRDVSPHKMFGGTEFSLADIKAIRQASDGATVNDVVLAVCAGGLRRYLSHHGELPAEPLVAWVPINARPRGGKVGDDENPGNNISAMTTSLHTDVEGPLSRLNDIHATTQETKEARSGVTARLMTDLSRHVPAASQVLAARLVTTMTTERRLCNLFISNVPGPQVPLYMNGARQIINYGLAPLNNGMGLFITTPSYNGRISFGVTSTREIMPDMAFFVECLEASFEELLDAARDIAPPAKPRRKVAKATAKKTTKHKATGNKAAPSGRKTG